MELPLFDFQTIAAGTSNFSRKNILGEGGFGPVYKVTNRHLISLSTNLSLPFTVIFRPSLDKNK